MIPRIIITKKHGKGKTLLEMLEAYSKSTGITPIMIPNQEYRREQSYPMPLPKLVMVSSVNVVQPITTISIGIKVTATNDEYKMVAQVMTWFERYLFMSQIGEFTKRLTGLALDHTQVTEAYYFDCIMSFGFTTNWELKKALESAQVLHVVEIKNKVKYDGKDYKAYFKNNPAFVSKIE